MTRTTNGDVTFYAVFRSYPDGDHKVLVIRDDPTSGREVARYAVENRSDTTAQRDVERTLWVNGWRYPYDGWRYLSTRMAYGEVKPKESTVSPPTTVWKEET